MLERQGFQRVVDVWQRQPASGKHFIEQILFGERITAQVVNLSYFLLQPVEYRLIRLQHQKAAVEIVIKIGGRRFTARLPGVVTMLRLPAVWIAGDLIRVAAAGVTGRQRMLAEVKRKQLIHVAQHQHIGIKKHHALAAGQLPGAQLAPHFTKLCRGIMLLQRGVRHQRLDRMDHAAQRL